jgi:hypothetical protein
LIQLSGRSGAGAAHPATTARNALSIRISKVARLTVRRSERGTWKPSSGRMPRRSGSIQ